MKDTRQVEVHRLEAWREELRSVRLVTVKYLIAAVVGALVCAVYIAMARPDYVALFLLGAVTSIYIFASLGQLKVVRFLEKDLLSYILISRIDPGKERGN